MNANHVSETGNDAEAKNWQQIDLSRDERFRLQTQKFDYGESQQSATRQNRAFSSLFSLSLLRFVGLRTPSLQTRGAEGDCSGAKAGA